MLGDYLALSEVSPHRRGRQFEVFIKQLLQREGLEVTPDVGTARPRQTDLLASLGSEHYLIETKWRERSADVGDIDSILARLDRIEPTVAGLFISVSGFSRSAIEIAEEKRARPVVLITGEELEGCLRDETSLWDLVTTKRNHMRTQGRMLFPLDEPGPRLDDSGAEDVGADSPARPTRVFVLDGQERSIVRSAGGFGRYVFAEDLADVDWGPTGGVGVRLDLTLNVRNELSVEKVFHALKDVGWVSGSGWWSIQQAADVWYGCGAVEFLRTLGGWKGRYQDLETVHHTEEATYFDVIDGGLFTLAIDMSAVEPRVVWHADLSLQLSGVPLDTSTIERFCSMTGAEPVTGFRAMNGPAVKLAFLRDEPSAKNLAPRGFSVERDASQWATGVWLDNPYFGGELPDVVIEEGAYDEPFALRETGLLLCTLRPGHPLADAQDSYSLRGLRWTWTSDALLLEVIAEGDYRP